MAATKGLMIQCLNCKHGTFMQWFHNPIICQCNMFNERFVAEAKHNCEEYEERHKPGEVTHYDKYD